MIATKIQEINANISQRMQAAGIEMRLFGIAEPIVRRSDNEDEFFPVIITANGECNDIFVDDDYEAGGYHRLTGKSYETQRKGYGDGGCENVTADMLMICWAKRIAAGNGENLEQLIYASLPQDVSPMQTNFNRAEVFVQEFTAIPFFLPEDIVLFCMKYKIKMTQNRKCI